MPPRGAKAEREGQSRNQLLGSICLMLKKGMVKCYHGGKMGHLKKNCRLLSNDNGKSKKSSQPGQHKRDTLVVEHVVQAGVMGNWIIDSGATCHICQDEILFSELQLLAKEMDVTLGDGHTPQATGNGTVPLIMNLPDGSCSKCCLFEALFVPSLPYSVVVC